MDSTAARTRITSLVVGTGVAALLVGCADGAERGAGEVEVTPAERSPERTPELEPSDSTEPSDPIEPSEPGDDVSTPGLPSSVTDPVVAAAVERTGVDPDQVTIVRAEPVTFSDGSLGCPQPGRDYTQALVDGYWVVVDADGEELDYRMTDRGRPRLCERGGSTPRPRRDV